MAPASSPAPPAGPLRDGSGAARRGALTTATAAVAVAAALILLPGLHQVTRLLGHCSPAWLAIAVVLESASCAGFVAVISSLFAQVPRPLSRRLAWVELGANVVLPAGGVSGLTLAAWVLRRRGLPIAATVRTSTAVFALTSVPNFVAVALVGCGMWSGLLPGSHRFALTGLPALAATSGLAAAGLVTGCKLTGNVAIGLEGLTLLQQALREARAHLVWRDRAAWGAFAYWAFDNAVLLVGLWSVGEHVAVSDVLMAYLLGQLGSLLPTPGGIGVLEGGLIGCLVLFGVEAAPAAAAVLLYRVVSLVVPLIGGVVASRALWRFRRCDEDTSYLPSA